MNPFWQIVVSNAVVATLLAIGVALLGRVWKNPAAMHVLWLAVLVKLVTPPFFNVPIPVVSDLLQRTAGTQSVSVGMASQGSGSEHHVAQNAVQTIVNPSNGAPIQNDQLKLRTTPVASGESRSWQLARVVAVVWIGGSVSVLCFYAISISRFVRSIRNSKPASANITATVARLAQRLQLRRLPEVVMTSRALPPLVWSIGGPPKLILPSELFIGLSEDARTAILTHELVHISRRDDLVRLLELATTTLFWWHPVVWWACSQLRDLEEQCCDSRVLELNPHQARSYALALVDTLEFLASRPCVFVPLPTAVGSTGTLSRRIQMLAKPGMNRLGVRGFAMAMAVAAFPLVFAIAGDSPSEVKKDASQPAAANVATVSGRVTNKAGEPLAGTRVTVAVPAIDMCFVDTEKPQRLLEANADADGKYRVRIPDLKEPTEVSVDAKKPGYRTLVGTLMRGGDAKSVKVSPAESAENSFSLEPALYFKGIVVDEGGKPIEGVEVRANSNTARSSGGVEQTTTRADGTFELFNYPLTPFEEEEKGVKVIPKGAAGFFHPDYIHQNIDDVYSLSPKEREAIRIQLPTGRKITGTLLDQERKPVSGVMVEAEQEKLDCRKATITDKEGKFVLRGLPAVATKLKAHAMNLKQKVNQNVDLDSDRIDMKLQMHSVVRASEPRIVSALGMQLTDISPELQSEYDLNYTEHGALILDPGKNSDRLDIGDLAEGYAFWMVGEKRINSVREFVDQILAEASTKDGSIPRVRVVYSLRDVDMVGTNTQHLTLTKEDLEQLRAVAKTLSDK